MIKINKKKKKVVIEITLRSSFIVTIKIAIEEDTNNCNTCKQDRTGI